MIPKKSLYAMATALGGVPVLGALSGSAAARAGVRYGDILLEVNGVPTPTMLDYIQARSRRDDGMDVVVFRAGERHELALALDERSDVDVTSLLADVATLRLGPIDDAGGDPGASS